MILSCLTSTDCMMRYSVLIREILSDLASASAAVGLCCFPSCPEPLFAGRVMLRCARTGAHASKPRHTVASHAVLCTSEQQLSTQIQSADYNRSQRIMFICRIMTAHVIKACPLRATDPHTVCLQSRHVAAKHVTVYDAVSTVSTCTSGRQLRCDSSVVTETCSQTVAAASKWTPIAEDVQPSVWHQPTCVSCGCAVAECYRR